MSIKCWLCQGQGKIGPGEQAEVCNECSGVGYILGVYHSGNVTVDNKATNPKDIIGSGKLPLELVPDTIEAEVALSFLEGALKYGRFNWRIAGVRASIYRAALRRHEAKWWNGEDRDQKTRVKHLASIIACAGILLDAELCGKLVDDRPPSAPIGKLIDEYDATVKHLKDLFKEHDPKQFTIADK